MDVILSIVAGLGLRIFLITSTTSGPKGKLTSALLGIWEGVIVHQLSARSRSPHFDHILAYVFRLVADLLISKNFLRLFMVLLWTAFGTLISEAVSPHASLRSALRREREREKERERERRHRHSRSSSEALPILSTPLPLRMRTTRPPRSESHLLSQVPQQSSTPLIHSIPPPTPPSFFLHETFDINSPSPKPVHLQTFQPVDSPIQDYLPVRPPSGLASILERSPGSLINVRNFIPTPPESAQSAAPSDGHDVQSSSADFHDTTKTITISPRRLSPIAELSSPDSTPPETVDQRNKTQYDRNQQLANLSSFEATSIAPPPVFNTVAYSSAPQVGANIMSSYSTKQTADDFFTTPFSPTMSPTAPIPVPIPQRNRQDPLWQTHTTLRNSYNINIEIPQIVGVTRDYNQSPESDQLQTPGLRDMLNAETDNEHDDPLLTPVQMKSKDLEAERDQLSPLGLNVHSGLDSDDYIRVSDAEGDSSNPPPDTPDNNEELHIPGSLSQNLLLQPPLPPSSPLPESPVPPSPSTIFSDTSMLSQLSTRVPSKLFLRADEFRKQARQEEQSREVLDNERKIAEKQGKTAEALMLKIRVRELDERSYKLHEKAARRYYAG